MSPGSWEGDVAVVRTRHDETVVAHALTLFGDDQVEILMELWLVGRELCSVLCRALPKGPEHDTITS